MTPQLQTLLNAATSMGIAFPDQLDLAEVYLWSQQLSVTDSGPTIFSAAADVMELTPQQRKMIRCFALAKKNGVDTNWQGFRQTVINNLQTQGQFIDPGRVDAALNYVLYRGLSVL